MLAMLHVNDLMIVAECRFMFYLNLNDDMHYFISSPSRAYAAYLL